jgi:hypothetical protein
MEVTAGAVPVVILLVLAVLVSGFVRLARGEAGREGGSWAGAVDCCGGGVVSFVITWIEIARCMEEKEIAVCLSRAVIIDQQKMHYYG